MATSLLSLPQDVLFLLPDYIHNIEDYTNFSSTCKALRYCMTAATPKAILRLAAAQSTTFFRPSPYVLVATTARELGNWARQSESNEAELALKLENGIDALMELALQHCGLTMQRIRETYSSRFSIINPVTDVIDKCVGQQWYAHDNFWDGGVSDAYTIDSEPHESLFHLAIYGELFGPDFEAFLNQDTKIGKLSVNTRLEYIKYCLPDFATTCSGQGWGIAESEIDARRSLKATGPYKMEPGEYRPSISKNHNIALTWVLQSSRWRPHWKQMREKAGPDFQEDFLDDWWFGPWHFEKDWRQRMWEMVMVCQGLEGLGMMRPGLQDRWIMKVRGWRERIASLEKEPELVHVMRQATLEYPYLLGDLRVCASGYVGGT